MAEPGGPEFPLQPEAPKQNPTEASKGFLAKVFQKATEGPTPFILSLGTLFVTNQFIGETIPSDIARGDYRSAAFKGFVAAVAFVPLTARIIRNH